MNYTDPTGHYTDYSHGAPVHYTETTNTAWQYVSGESVTIYTRNNDYDPNSRSSKSSSSNKTSTSGTGGSGTKTGDGDRGKKQDNTGVAAKVVSLFDVACPESDLYPHGVPHPKPPAPPKPRNTNPGGSPSNPGGAGPDKYKNELDTLMKQPLYQPIFKSNGDLQASYCNIGLLDWFGGSKFKSETRGSLSYLFDYDISMFGKITCPKNGKFLEIIKNKAILLEPEYAQEIVNEFGKPAGIFGTWPAGNFWHCMIITVDDTPYNATRGPKIGNIGKVNDYMYLNEITSNWNTHYKNGELLFFTLPLK
jgi:hypothetical protein